MSKQRVSARQVVAARNIEAVLDAAQRLLQRGEEPSMLAVASEAGVSRPTLYGHFPDRKHLLEALVERAVRGATEAMASAEPERGPAVEALQRLVASGWQELARNEEINRGAAAELSGDAMRRAHEAVRTVIRGLVERGRKDGSFRTDVPTDWLVTSCLALIHAAAEEVRARQLEQPIALDVLSTTIADLLVGRQEVARRLVS